jgi:uncharacterized protein YuzE
MSIRIDRYDGQEVLYFAVDPDGVWARSEFPEELVTIDYNSKGSIIGIELVGSAARHGVDAFLKAIMKPQTVRDALRPLVEH